MQQKSPDPPSPHAVLEAIRTGVGWSGNEKHLEGWHNQMKVIARKAHPNLCEVLEPRENRLQQKPPLNSWRQVEHADQIGRGGPTTREDYITVRGSGDSNVDSRMSAIQHCSSLDVGY